MARIGVLDAPEEQVFGAIEDGTIDAYGRILVLDSQARDLRVFDEGGRLLQILGGAGRGPGEFSAPRALTLILEGHLLVLDGIGTVTVFEAGRDSLRYSRVFRVEGDIFDGCVLGNRLYIHGLKMDDPSVIHVYSLEGEHVRSFAEVYRTRNPIIRQQLSRGRIACMEGADVLFLAPALLPEVRAYNPTGELLWWTKLEGFRPLQVTETPTGASLLRASEGGHHLNLSLIPLGDHGPVILQIAHLTPEPRQAAAGPDAPHTLLLSVDGSGGVHAGDRWPRILHGSADRLIGAWIDPYPHLTVFRTAPR